MNVTLFSLPGFLGKPDDWLSLIPERESRCHVACSYEDSFTECMSAWSRKFNARILQHHGSPQKNQLNILLGYSLGARLALHILQDNPTLWNGAILVSAHLGLDHCDERIKNDHLWAQKFLNEPWKEVLAAWNAQEVLKSSKTPFNRVESQYNKGILSDVLTHWSVGKQQNFLPSLHRLILPILWCSGEKDKKHAETSKKLVFKHPQSKVVLFSEAGHRVPWDQPEKFISELETFIHSLKGS